MEEPILTNTLSEGAVGIFDENILATRLDTMERRDALFSDFNIPPLELKPIVPKDLRTDDLITSSNVPKLSDYLGSSDPKLNKLANDYLDQKLATNKAFTHGYGMPRMVRYQPGQNKFTEDKWFRENAYTEHGFDPDVSLAENEDWINKNVWDDFSLLGKTWRFAGTVAGRVLSKVATGLVSMVATFPQFVKNLGEEGIELFGGPKNEFFADMSENVIVRAMDSVDDYTKQWILPTYKSITYDEKGAFSKLSDPYFWMNDGADGIGFLLQFAVPATAFGRLTQAARIGKAPRIFGVGIGEAATASKASKITGKVAEFLTGSRNLGGITAHAFNTTMESLIETNEGFKNNIKELIEKGYTEEEAKRIAAEYAPSQFWLNMAILTASNAWENKFFQKLAKNRRGTAGYINEAGLIEEVAKQTRRLPYYGKMWIKASIMEGWWEENAQLAAQRAAVGHYIRNGDDTKYGKTEYIKRAEGIIGSTLSFLSQLKKQTIDSSWWGKGDREAADSILAGATIGILGSTAFSKLTPSNEPSKSPEETDVTKNREGNYESSTKRSKFQTLKDAIPFIGKGGERKNIKRANQRLVADVLNARDAFLSISISPNDILGDEGLDKDKVDKKLMELTEKLQKLAFFSRRNLKVEDITDPNRREALQYELFADYVKGHILNGTGNQLIEKIRNWDSKTKEELALYGVTTEIAKDSKKWASIAEDLLSSYNEIDNIRFENNTKESIDDFLAKERAIKSYIYTLTAKSKAYANASLYLDSIELDISPFREGGLKQHPLLASYNEKLLLRDALVETKDKLVAEEKEFEKRSNFFDTKIAKLNEELALMKDALPEHVEIGANKFAADKTISTKDAYDTINKNSDAYLETIFENLQLKDAVEDLNKSISKFKNPKLAIAKYNELVDTISDIQDKENKNREKLKDLGYTVEQIEKMTTDEIQKALTEPVVTTEEQEETKSELTIEEKWENMYKSKGLDVLEQYIKLISKKYAPTRSFSSLKEAAVQLLEMISINISLPNNGGFVLSDLLVDRSFLNFYLEKVRLESLTKTTEGNNENLLSEDEIENLKLSEIAKVEAEFDDYMNNLTDLSDEEFEAEKAKQELIFQEKLNQIDEKYRTDNEEVVASKEDITEVKTEDIQSKEVGTLEEISETRDSLVEKRDNLLKEKEELSKEKKELQDELENIEKKRQLEERVREEAEKTVTEQEKKDIANEIDILESDVFAAIVESVSQEMTTGKSVDTKGKPIFRRVIDRIKKFIISLFAAGILWTGIGGTTINKGGIDWSKNTLIENTISIFPEEQEQWAKRFLEKKGIYQSNDQIIEVVENIEESSINIDTLGLVQPKVEILAVVPDSYNKKDSLMSYRSTWNNKDGFQYIPGPNRSQSKDIKYIPGVLGVGHFLLDGSLFNGEYSHPYNKEYLNKAKANNDYVPVFTRLPNGRVLLKYKRAANMLPSDIYVSPLRQFKVSDVNWESQGKAHGFAKPIKEIKKNDGSGTYLIFKDKDGYSRFSGGSVVFIFENKGNEIVIDFAGSINQIKNESERISREYNIPLEQIILGYHDVGSFSAKPKSKDGNIQPSQYSGYNNSEFTGGGLLIPMPDSHSGNANVPNITILSLLLTMIRRKRENNEPITQDDIDAINRRLNEIEERLIAINKDIYDIQNQIDRIPKKYEPVNISLPIELNPNLPEGYIAPSASLPPPPPPPVINTNPQDGGNVPSELYKQLKEIYDINERALSLGLTLTELARSEGFVIQSNKISNFSNQGKLDGTFNIITSNPKDLENEKIKSKHNNYARFNFLKNIIDNELNKNDFKLVLTLQGDQLMAFVTDINGDIVKFNEDGLPAPNGTAILIGLDWDMYSKENINKRREDIVYKNGKVVPGEMVIVTNETIHPSFLNIDPIDMLKSAMQIGQITASIEFTTQGMLYRDGVTNSLDARKLPKVTNLKTAEEFISEKHTLENKGFISQSKNLISSEGKLIQPFRLNINLLRDISDKKAGFVSVEFTPVNIKDAKTIDGKNLLDVLKTEDGRNLIEAAVSGTLLYNTSDYNKLIRLLRPDKFLVMNTGTHLLVVNLANFKKLLKFNEDISYEKLMSITDISDIYNSPLNINAVEYNNTAEILRMEDILGTGEDNYSKFIHKNVVSSAKPVEVNGKIGYHSINKRLGIKVDMSIDDIIKKVNMQNEVNMSKPLEVSDATPDSEIKTPKPTGIEDEIKGFKIQADDDLLFNDLCK